MKENHYLGIDVGGTGIKAALVDVSTGELVTDRFKKLTPEPKDFNAISEVISDFVNTLEWNGAIGIGFPSLIKNGRSMTATNIHSSWIDFPIVDKMKQTLDRDVHVLNDADAAGLAEKTYGLCKELKGTTILLTIGTGIGSALLYDNMLIPSTELGHLQFKGDIAEQYCSNAARKREKLKWKEWAKRFDAYLHHLADTIGVDQFVIGGGISKRFDEYKEYFTVDRPIFPATFKNSAGVIGAALYASR